MYHKGNSIMAEQENFVFCFKLLKSLSHFYQIFWNSYFELDF